MRHFSELISAYLDGELTLAEARQLNAHLGSCGHCAAELEATQRVRAAIRSLPVVELPPGLVPEADVEVVPLHRHRGLWMGAAAAAVAAVITIAALLSPPPQSNLTMEDLGSRFGARVSLDPAFGPAKLVTLDFEPQVVDR